MNTAQKGKQFQWKIARILCSIFGFSEDDVFSCHGGKKERDIKLSEEALKTLPFHFECKNQKSVSIRTWMAQAESDAYHEGKNLMPVLVHKFHGVTATYVTMKLEDFLYSCYTLTAEQIIELRRIEKDGK